MAAKRRASTPKAKTRPPANVKRKPPTSKALVVPTPVATPLAKASTAKGAKALAGAAFSAALAGGAAKAGLSHDVAAMGLILLFGPTYLAVMMSTQGTLEALREPCARYTRAVLARFGAATDGDDVAAKRFAEKVAAAPGAQRTVVDNIRRLLEAVAPDAVAEPIAKLTAEYVDVGRAPDAFSRGVTRTLAELSSEELAAFVDLVRRTHTIDGGFESGDVALTSKRVPHGTPPTLVYAYSKTSAAPRSEADFPSIGEVVLADRDYTFRLFHLLRVNGLGREGSAINHSGAGPHVVVVRFDELRRLAALLTVSA